MIYCLYDTWGGDLLDRGSPMVQARAGLSCYQPEPEPEIYIVPVSSILGRMPLVPAGDTEPSQLL